MIDIEMVDKLFEAGREKGVAVQFRIFDKKMLLSLEQLPHAVKGETGEEISEQAIRERAMEGWFPLLTGAGWCRMGGRPGERQGAQDRREYRAYLSGREAAWIRGVHLSSLLLPH
jgi:hypothetical protein